MFFVRVGAKTGTACALVWISVFCVLLYTVAGSLCDCVSSLCCPDCQFVQGPLPSVRILAGMSTHSIRLYRSCNVCICS